MESTKPNPPQQLPAHHCPIAEHLEEDTYVSRTQSTLHYPERYSLDLHSGGRQALILKLIQK